jgi:hypothetical protein
MKKNEKKIKYEVLKTTFSAKYNFGFRSKRESFWQILKNITFFAVLEK